MPPESTPPIGRYVFQCSIEECHEVIIVPGTSTDDAASFLLEETPWSARVSVDESHLLCPEHRDHRTSEGTETESKDTNSNPAHTYGLIVCRGGRWFTILDPDQRHDFMAEFATEAEAKDFAETNPICQDAQVVLLINFTRREIEKPL